ncbi:SH3 domain-containing protein [Treponema sp.]|uniref:SH3 domain-containing protein n=1 Tax=Treponema sp. TaxID=166 RepID=UPI00298DF8AD|nr:SH3 domain-containing protein [Treponema sp.]MCR5614061.1 SH3 domain-containing protein [Treponema sp.]
MKKFLVILVFVSSVLGYAQTDLDTIKQKFSEEKYVISWYCDVLKSQNRETVHKYTDIHSNKTTSDMDGTFTWVWYNHFEPCILNCFFADEYGCNVVEVGNLHYFLISDCYAEDGKYYVKGKENRLYKNKHDKLCPIDWNPVRKFDEFTFIFVFDGDYLSIYFNEEKPANLFATFCRLNAASYNEFDKLIKQNSCSLSKVTWPRHADGSCDYDGSKKQGTGQTSNAASKTNVAVNKIMTAAENLKLRAGEATSSQVLTVMSAGTNVKILELGKAETIDGINSNWVKVEVQKGAKDRDGKAIKTGTVGWCYGGYLK